MRVGNAIYRDIADLPRVLPLLTVHEHILLPKAALPITLKEPAHLMAVEEALQNHRLLGVVQAHQGSTALPPIGCVGRITRYEETGRETLKIKLRGICRFRLGEKVNNDAPYSSCFIDPFAHDFNKKNPSDDHGPESFPINAATPLQLEHMPHCWNVILDSSSERLVNTFAMSASLSVEEKQALLEVEDFTARARLLVEMAQKRRAS